MKQQTDEELRASAETVLRQAVDAALDFFDEAEVRKIVEQEMNRQR
jgi:hypothetical protein